jgi:hypothetical protein
VEHADRPRDACTANAGQLGAAGAMGDTTPQLDPPQRAHDEVEREDGLERPLLRGVGQVGAVEHGAAVQPADRITPVKIGELRRAVPIFSAPAWLPCFASNTKHSAL